MASSNEPIEVSLPGRGPPLTSTMQTRLILTQLRYYPLAQLILIAVFAFVAYLIFSMDFAEQSKTRCGWAWPRKPRINLGTPLSSLMAWVGLLEDQGVQSDYLKEMNRDIVRLNTVVDRFSKIGSKPILREHNVIAVVRDRRLNTCSRGYQKT